MQRTETRVAARQRPPLAPAAGAFIKIALRPACGSPFPNCDEGGQGKSEGPCFACELACRRSDRVAATTSGTLCRLLAYVTSSRTPARAIMPGRSSDRRLDTSRSVVSRRRLAFEEGHARAPKTAGSIATLLFSIWPRGIYRRISPRCKSAECNLRARSAVRSTSLSAPLPRPVIYRLVLCDR